MSRGGGCLPAALLVAALIGWVGERKGVSTWGVAAAVAGAALAATGVRRWWSRTVARAEERRRLAGRTLQELDRLAGTEFEEWIATVLRRARLPVERPGGGPDYGIDLVTRVEGARVGIQAKRLGRPVGNAAVQQALAGSDFHGCHVAAVVTQSSFTRQARMQAEAAHLPVVLVGRKELADLVGALRRGARRAARAPSGHR